MIYYIYKWTAFIRASISILEFLSGTEKQLELKLYMRFGVDELQCFFLALIFITF
jgi:hypothetical protein